jgi:hypothetical protein
MHTNLAVAGALIFLIGVGHSIIGEHLIFRQLRVKGLVPTLSAPPLRARHVHILWASWHIVTVYAFAFSALLIKLAIASTRAEFKLFAVQTTIAALLASAMLVLVATKGKHPAWLGLLAVVLLLWLR